MPPRSSTPPPRELTCRDAVAFLASYLGGELAPLERARFDAHLAACPDCRTYLAQYEQTRALSRAALDDDAVDAVLPEELVQAILAARK